MTTKTTAKATKTAKETTAADSVSEATSKVTEGAREFVKRSAETVQERAEGVYENSKTYNAQIEDTLKRAASGYANVLSGITGAAFANLNHTLNAVEKLADAKTVSDAMQIQVEFVREHTQQNMDHVRSAYDYVREVTADNAGMVRDGYNKMWTAKDSKAA